MAPPGGTAFLQGRGFRRAEAFALAQGPGEVFPKAHLQSVEGTGLPSQGRSENTACSAFPLQSQAMTSPVAA